MSQIFEQPSQHGQKRDTVTAGNPVLLALEGKYIVWRVRFYGCTWGDRYVSYQYAVGRTVRVGILCVFTLVVTPQSLVDVRSSPRHFGGID